MAKNKGLGRGLGGLISGGISPKQVKKATALPTTQKIVRRVTPQAPPTTEPQAPVLDGTVPFAAVAAERQAEDAAAATGLLEIALTKIRPNPHQPRKAFEAESLAELAESIRAEGLLQPVVVRPVEGGYELIAGERRLRACQSLKLKRIPARIIEASEASSAVLSLIENLQREDLNPIEEAMGYASLIRDFELTQEAVAERVGRGRPTVANALRLLQLPREIQGYLGKRLLSPGHAKVLLGVEQAANQLLLARQVIERNWSVRELERQVNLVGGQAALRRERSSVSAEQTAIRDLERQIASKLSTKVQLRHAAKRGKLIIEYHGNDDLQRLMERMGLAD